MQGFVHNWYRPEQPADLRAGAQANRDLARDLGIDEGLQQALDRAHGVDFNLAAELGLNRVVDLGQALERAQQLGIRVNIDLSPFEGARIVRARKPEAPAALSALPST